ncbi:hypothetical protein [Methanonatronarchaeum sp. AMET6-2]|uniref:hypothetical protein n=1 Tax=Methanonatronarchaeum sp. AMET6-2 TaxID=2933293 RepID=UPI0012120958|nr:hypothetical protein [Methanonatronarchaeum sp. AMET6-2]RZN61885.1 MAG: hypothetical protein EF811_04075 [Methanonatronarchaeia archaeon]UOY10615.1 hypothetical protein MU439_02965 [Methanonatronarchaeum sp. AMET6-2]
MFEIKNWYKYLWLLGFLGLLGLYTDNWAYYGFFGFFGFIAFRFSKPAQVDLNRSARNSFIASLIIFGTFTPYATIVDIPDLYISGYALTFAIMIIVFVISMAYYEKPGR